APLSRWRRRRDLPTDPRRLAPFHCWNPGTATMTLTSLGILLIVNGVLLWAIMAALHRHTVVLKDLQLQMQGLLARQAADEAAARQDYASAVLPRELSRSRKESVDSTR